MKKIPTIILSITYRGVKFIDASNKVCFSQVLVGGGAPSPCPASLTGRVSSLKCPRPPLFLPIPTLASEVVSHAPTHTDPGAPLVPTAPRLPHTAPLTLHLLRGLQWPESLREQRAPRCPVWVPRPAHAFLSSTLPWKAGGWGAGDWM